MGRACGASSLLRPEGCSPVNQTSSSLAPDYRAFEVTRVFGRSPATLKRAQPHERSSNMCGQERGFALLVVTLLLAVSGSNLANGSTVAFKARVTYPVGTNPAGVSVGDFNGDGEL